MGVIAKYKFNNTLEANLLPEFNSEFTSDLYTVTDEVEGEVTTRTIESGMLPTLMRFGRVYVEGETAADNRTDSLLEVLDMNTSGLTSCNNMFRYCKNLTSISCEWNTSNVTDMQIMFSNCINLTTLDVSNFDTSNVTNMSFMFRYCNNLTTLDLSNCNTSKVANMQSMFYNCNNLTTLDVSNFNTSNVTNMSTMFANCKKLTSLDVSNFNTSNVTDMSTMFQSCINLTSLDVSNFNTSKATNVSNMFQGCYNLTSLDVSNFNTSKVTNMYGMFANMINLTSLRCPNLTTDSLTSIGRIFKGNTNLATLDISNLTIDTSVVTDYTEIFLESPNIKYIKCNNTDTINLVVSQLPTRASDNQGIVVCKSDTTNLDTDTLSSKYWNILDEPTLIAKYVFDSSIHNNCIPEFNTEFEGYFIEDEVVEGNNEVTRTIESCDSLPTLMRFGRVWVEGETSTDNRTDSLLEVLDMNTSGLTSCYGMFRYCISLTSITCEWDTSKVTYMQSMFEVCQSLTSLDVSNFNTSNVITMGYVFNGCNKLTTLDVSNWVTSKVANMNSMFFNCTKLTSLDVSNFNTSNVTNTTNMFYNTPLLTDIGVLYMDKSSLQKLVNAMPTDSNKTLWYKDVNIDGITYGDNITLKKYIEENVEIVLNSPLLEGDTIEVVDGKLCHYHKMGKVVFDGSENWAEGRTTPTGKLYGEYGENNHAHQYNTECTTDTLPSCDAGASALDIRTSNGFSSALNGEYQYRIYIHGATTMNDIKQWLQANPTTVVYELIESYYEDITPYQSSLTLRTFEECNIQIITALPIKTKITYRTNITSAVVMEQELDTLDSGVSLSNLIEEEVDE